MSGYVAVLVALSGVLVAGSLALEHRRRFVAWVRWRARRPRLDTRDLVGWRRQPALWRTAKP